MRARLAEGTNPAFEVRQGARPRLAVEIEGIAHSERTALRPSSGQAGVTTMDAAERVVGPW
jgi:hypothetical protein